MADDRAHGVPRGVAGAVVPALRAALDEVLARGGFAWNPVSPHGDVLEVLYEALPADATRLVPHVAPLLGDLDGWCLDLWLRYDARQAALVSVTLEGCSVPELLREAGHDAAAAEVEAAVGLDAQLAAYAAAFATLFAPPPAGDPAGPAGPPPSPPSGSV